MRVGDVTLRSAADVFRLGLGSERLHRPAAGHLGAHHRADVGLQSEVVDQPELAVLLDEADAARVGRSIHPECGTAGLKPGFRHSLQPCCQRDLFAGAALLQQPPIPAEQLPGATRGQAGARSRA